MKVESRMFASAKTTRKRLVYTERLQGGQFAIQGTSDQMWRLIFVRRQNGPLLQCLNYEMDDDQVGTIRCEPANPRFHYPYVLRCHHLLHSSQSFLRYWKIFPVKSHTGHARPQFHVFHQPGASPPIDQGNRSIEDRDMRESVFARR